MRAFGFYSLLPRIRCLRTPSNTITKEQLHSSGYHTRQRGMLEIRQSKGQSDGQSLLTPTPWQIKTCIFLATEVPDFLCDGAVYGEDKVLGLDRLLVQVACLGLRSKSAGLFINEDPKHSLDAQQLEKLSEEAKALDDALAAWPDADANANADGDEWKVVRLPIHPTLAPASSPTVRPYGDAVHRYQSHAHAAIWNTHRAVRIAVNSIRTRSLSHLLRQCSSPSHALILTEQLHLCRQRVDLSVRELRGSVPFFGDFSIAARKGFEELTTEKRLTLSDAKIVPMMAALLAWPLKVALSTEAAQGTQRQYLKSALETVAESLQDASLRSIVKQG
ncbi:hypothetical protein A1O3_04723 [Capronia epimyces CBS 606.96]|uniref:Uncharacterized protein n=1 Tax=Capronia epimyces CBS 606.96 TaxID=1182542 RepID=W9Y4A9_9EURO|nr:uncharacterized protein A1O3_04723 [Capronia epimyces CBS 606.96]EXJ84056.1 hypothetical protein A1O3_04723 [Capronia epimyces CBS 606.96]